MDYYGDYYSGLLVNRNGQYKKPSIAEIAILIDDGLSSVKIAKQLNVNYKTILTIVDKELPNLSDKLRENGRRWKIRRKSAKN